MDFRITEEQELMVQAIEEAMTRENLEPYFQDCDKNHTHPEKWWEILKELGCFSMFLPEEAEGERRTRWRRRRSYNVPRNGSFRTLWRTNLPFLGSCKSRCTFRERNKRADRQIHAFILQRKRSIRTGILRANCRY